MEIKHVDSSEVPIALLLEADPSITSIRKYLARSLCAVAALDGEMVGAYVVRLISTGTYELMNIAVAPAHQRKGIGSALLRDAIDTVRECGARRLEVGTGTFGYQLAYYQKAGFRPFSLEIDHFLKNYQDPIYENGIQHKDMMRLAITY